MSTLDLITEIQRELIDFTQSLIRIKSYSGQEEEVIRFIEKKMKALGYDEVIIDSMGNLLGRIGNGEKSILFDSHVDTVAVNDKAEWDIPPFSGNIVCRLLLEKKNVDMKSSVASSIYSGALANTMGL